MLKPSLTILLISCLPLLAGCLPTPASPRTTATTETQKITSATRIADILIHEASKGTRITLKADGPLGYQIFQKTDPPRILLTFPNVKIDSAIQPRLVNLSTISGLFPSETPNHDGQLELTLPNTLEYDIQETPLGLELTVLAKNPTSAKKGPQIRDAHITRVQDGSEIRFTGTGQFPDPKIFRTEDPPRMVVDFPDMAGPKESRTIPADTLEAASAQLVAIPGKTRMIVELANPGIAYHVTREQDVPVIHLTNRPDIDGTPAVTGVFFSRDQDDALTRIQLNKEGFAAQSNRQGTDLILTLKKTTASQQWIRRMDVREFGGPVNFVDLQPQGENLIATLRLNHDAGQHDILQKEQEILIRIKPAQKLGQSTEEIFPYSGQNVSLDVKDIDIQNALRFMAEIAKINIILSDTVTGTLTMRITDVPWDQALDLMLEAKQLGKIKQGNVLRIAPLSEIQKSTETRITDQNNKKQLEPVVTEMIPVSFAQAEAIKTLLLEGDQAKGTRILSSQGTVSLDQRTNTLIVKDMAGNLAHIRELVNKLDRPIPQVLIEARIVEVTRTSLEALGINWGLNYRRNNEFAVSSNISNAYETQQFNINGIDVPRPQMSASSPLNVNLMPASAGTMGMHLGSISPLLDLDIELGAMENTGKLTAISSPRILTTNNQAASISQGSSQPYPTRDSTGATTYEYIDATLSLTVTPQITPNKYIIMQVQATNNTPGTSSSAAPPPINKQEIKTRALVKDGETIVLGGIYRTNDSDDITGVPHFQDIPILGWMFKQQTQNNAQRELLIFLTPRIIEAAP